MATRHMGLIVTGCLIGGLVAALALVLGPLAGAQEHMITGTVLLTFSASWRCLRRSQCCGPSSHSDGRSPLPASWQSPAPLFSSSHPVAT
jgi:hypothetical protein